MTEKQKARRRAYYRRWCKENREKLREHSRKWAAAHPASVREKFRRWYDANKDALAQRRRATRKKEQRTKEAVSLYKRKRAYGITKEQFAKLLELQGGRCPVCIVALRRGTKNGLHVDHDHSTGVVRGLLCGRCNIALGYLKDDPRRARAAAEYLENHAASLGSQRRWNGRCNIFS